MNGWGQEWSQLNGALLVLWDDCAGVWNALSMVELVQATTARRIAEPRRKSPSHKVLLKTAQPRYFPLQMIERCDVTQAGAMMCMIRHQVSSASRQSSVLLVCSHAATSYWSECGGMQQGMTASDLKSSLVSSASRQSRYALDFQVFFRHWLYCPNSPTHHTLSTI